MEIQPTIVDIASPRRGRKPLQPTIVSPDDEGALLEQAAAPMVAAIRQSAMTLHKGEFAQSLHMAQGQGMFQALDYIQKFSGIARLKWLAERKQYGDYKGVSVADSEGGVRQLKTFEDLCDYVGQSKAKIYEDLQNLALMGEEILQAQEALGLGYRELRKLRAGLKELPADEQKALLEKVKAAEDKEDILILLDETTIQKEKLKQKNKELQEDAKAKDKLAQAKNARIDALTLALQKATSLVPDEHKEKQNAFNMECRAALDAECTKLLGAVVTLTNMATELFQHEDTSEDTCNYAHKRISLLCGDMSRVILEAGVDVDFTAEFVPEYLQGLDAESASTGSSESVEA